MRYFYVKLSHTRDVYVYSSILHLSTKYSGQISSILITAEGVPISVTTNMHIYVCTSVNPVTNSVFENAPGIAFATTVCSRLSGRIFRANLRGRSFGTSRASSARTWCALHENFIKICMNQMHLCTMRTPCIICLCQAVLHVWYSMGDVCTTHTRRMHFPFEKQSDRFDGVLS